MNKELLANIRNILIPTLASRLKKTNYEGQGEKDAIEFTHDMTEIFDLAEQQLSAHPNWIPVTERQPEYGVEVLTINTDGDYEINHIIDEEDAEWFFDGVIAWMPLPEPYKEEQDD